MSRSPNQEIQHILHRSLVGELQAWRLRIILSAPFEGASSMVAHTMVSPILSLKK